MKKQFKEYFVELEKDNIYVNEGFTLSDINSIKNIKNFKEDNQVCVDLKILDEIDRVALDLFNAGKVSFLYLEEGLNKIEKLLKEYKKDDLKNNIEYITDLGYDRTYDNGAKFNFCKDLDKLSCIMLQDDIFMKNLIQKPNILKIYREYEAAINNLNEQMEVFKNCKDKDFAKEQIKPFRKEVEKIEKKNKDEIKIMEKLIECRENFLKDNNMLDLFNDVKKIKEENKNIIVKKHTM